MHCERGREPAQRILFCRGLKNERYYIPPLTRRKNRRASAKKLCEIACADSKEFFCSAAQSNKWPIKYSTRARGPVESAKIQNVALRRYYSYCARILPRHPNDADENFFESTCGKCSFFLLRKNLFERKKKRMKE